MNDFQVVLDQDPRASLTELECAPAFMDGSAYVFQHPQILRIWLNTIGAARSTKPYFIRIIGPEADPIAVLPLGIETSGTCRILRFLDGGVSDYNAPIPIGKFDVFERLDAAQLWSKIIEVLPRFDLALLHKIPRMVGSLPNFLARLKVEPHHSNGHIATLSGNWDNYFSNRPKSSRTQKNRRLRERLAQCG
ncbi:MAG TPA: hypothetical protein VHN11_15520, partial [Xanthobacteraceae bacterium]|nr:hypothetical protein [Xanthobacteraceae bacterium]